VEKELTFFLYRLNGVSTKSLHLDLSANEIFNQSYFLKILSTVYFRARSNKLYLTLCIRSVFKKNETRLKSIKEINIYIYASNVRIYTFKPAGISR